MTKTQERTQIASHDERSEVDAAVALTRALEGTVTFVPFQESEQLVLSADEVRQYIATPTKTGKLPTDRQIGFFLKLCKYRKLNPWVKDVYLIGYDTKDGPKFDSVVAHQAMLKRADANGHYRGMKSGVIVWDTAANKVSKIDGDTVPKSLVIVGGWASVFRDDREVPVFKTATLKAYQKEYGYWQLDPGWMITKCAESKALREAFPNELGGMFSMEESGAMEKAETYRDETHNAEVFPAAWASRVPAELEGVDTSEETMYQSRPDAPKDIGMYLGVGCTELERRLAEATNLGQISAIEEWAFSQCTNDDDPEGSAIDRQWAKEACRARADAIRAERSESDA